MLRTGGNPLLSIQPTDAQGQLKDRRTLKRRARRRKLLNALESENAVKDLRELPGRDESIHCIARGNFPLWAIVPAALKLARPAAVDALHIATLSFNDQNTAELLALFDAGKVRAVWIVASAFFERQNPKEYRLMADGLAGRRQSIVALRSHAKVITMAMSDGRRFVVESSANLRSCRNIEQFTLTEAPDLYEFHRRWIEDVTAAATAAKARDHGR
jgi:hypothetical protein